jgi:hypothetical protein
VAGADGTRSWIKVTGRHHPDGDAMRGNEIAAGSLAGLPKPAVLGHAEWRSRGIHWRALQMTLAPSPAVETTPWPGERARMVTDGWIEQLRDALDDLGRVPGDGSHLPPDQLGSLIRSRFGVAAPRVADEWRVSYCEAHWANLTAPQLTLLDWELWGLAPRGYDGALIVAFSAADPPLMRRLETAFADDLQTPSGRVARLAACAQLLGWIEMGLIHPGLRGPLEQLAYRALHGP